LLAHDVFGKPVPPVPIMRPKMKKARIDRAFVAGVHQNPVL